MMFLSLPFVILFTCCLILYYTVKGSYQKPVLLLTSCIFVGYFNIAYLLIAALIAAITFYWGRWIGMQEQENKRRRVFVGGIVFLVLFLVAFKYLNFIGENIAVLLGWFGVDWKGAITSVFFPLGISFYTFQALGYLIDVYWEEEEPERSLPDFMLYMLFFMKFLSGPIERAFDMLPQLKIEKRFDYDTVTYGLKLMMIGLMKKVLIADRLAPHLDNIFASVQDASGAQLLLAGLLYPIELYADFSGYTDMAIGGAMMFGYRLSPNFNRPFVAKTITDFWRRWHMSLSFWVRDYLYQPIAASKRYWGQWGIVYALVVTFVLLGVWHGAGWNYVIYGLIQGLIISYEMVTVAYRNKVETSVGKHVFGVYSILRTYLLFAFSLLFFRLPSLSDAGYMISHLSFNLHTSIKELRLGMTDQECIVAGVAVVVLFLYEYFMSKRDLLQALSERHRIIRWGVYYLLVLLMFLFGQFGSEDFIYLQF